MMALGLAVFSFEFLVLSEGVLLSASVPFAASDPPLDPLPGGENRCSVFDTLSTPTPLLAKELPRPGGD